jgi:hypothetical protein
MLPFSLLLLLFRCLLPMLLFSLLLLLFRCLLLMLPFCLLLLLLRCLLPKLPSLLLTSSVFHRSALLLLLLLTSLPSRHFTCLSTTTGRSPYCCQERLHWRHPHR